MDFAFRVLACGFVTLLATAALNAQETPPQCPASEAHRFDFLIGNWHGREYLIKGPSDSTLDDMVATHNRKLPFGCAFEETIRYTPPQGAVVQGIILRSYDMPSASWRYAETSNYVELGIFDGVRTDSGWAFTHTITTTTPHRLLRFQWVPTRTGYTHIIQVSTDSGRTWPILRHLNYTRDSGR
jgi:hypothetical protein